MPAITPVSAAPILAKPMAPTAAPVDAAPTTGALTVDRTGASMPSGLAVSDAEASALAIRPDAVLPRLAPVGGSSARLLVDEPEVLPEMLAAVRGARHSVDLAMFALADSGAGKEMVDSLVDRAANGVKVRVTVDQVGSAVVPGLGGRDLIERLQGAGVQVAVNDRIEGKKLQAVDHRKLLVVDGTTAFTGGMNFSKKFGKWHDVMVRIEGPAVRQFEAHFTDRWTDLTGGPRQLVTPSTGTAGPLQAGNGVALLVNHPKQDLHASEHLLQNIQQAKERAWILTPTLSDPAVVNALKDAARAGVDTRVAVSGPEGWIGTRALGVIGSTFYRDLVNAGVKVYEQPGMSHAKVSLVDGVASVGSLNMTRRAMIWDHELMMASDEKPFVQQIEGLFEKDFGRSTLVSAERANSITARAGELLRKGTGLKW